MYVCMHAHMYPGKHEGMDVCYTPYIYIYIYIYICVYVCVTGMEFRLRKRHRGSDAFIVFRDSGMDASRCADK